MCVEGSVFSKRRAMYPVNLEEWRELNPIPSVEVDPDETERRLRAASKTGKHQKDADDDEDYGGYYSTDTYDEFH
jgi:hypothetical protein